VIVATIDWDALLEVVWSAALAGVGVTAAFGIAILGVTRAVDLRRGGQGAAATAAGLVGLLALALVATAVVLAIVVMTTK
jgi:hypothetical protein